MNHEVLFDFVGAVIVFETKATEATKGRAC